MEQITQKQCESEAYQIEQLFELRYSGCYLNDADLRQIYGHLFNAINPKVYYNDSQLIMTQEALRVAQNNLKHILKMLQTILPSNHDMQEELEILLSIAEKKTASQPPK